MKDAEQRISNIEQGTAECRREVKILCFRDWFWMVS